MAWFLGKRFIERRILRYLQENEKMLTKIAQALASILGFMNGKKTVTGIISMVVGYAVYLLQSQGIDVAEPAGLGKQIVDVLVQILFDGGGILAALGLGHKMGKETP